MSINGDVLVKLAAGWLPNPVPKIVRRNGGLGREATRPNSTGDVEPSWIEPIEDFPVLPPDEPVITFPETPTLPERVSRASKVGRAAGRAVRNVRDGAVNTANDVSDAISDAVRGFGQGLRGK